MREWTLVLCGGLMLAGCGGDDNSPPSYDFVTPSMGAMRTYSETIVDNSNNTVDIGYSETVTAVNSDGSYAETVDSTTGDSTVVDGTNYAVVAQMGEYNASGQETSYVYTGSDGSPVTCTYTPHSQGPDWPLQVGQTFSITYTLACGSAAATTYTQTGSIVDVETVSVPAGSYSALKVQSTLTFTDANGTTRSQSITNWRDVATSQSVQQDITITVSGTPPTTGYPVSRTIVLESAS